MKEVEIIEWEAYNTIYIYSSLGVSQFIGYLKSRLILFGAYDTI